MRPESHHCSGAGNATWKTWLGAALAAWLLLAESFAVAHEYDRPRTRTAKRAPSASAPRASAPATSRRPTHFEPAIATSFVVVAAVVVFLVRRAYPPVCARPSRRFLHVLSSRRSGLSRAVHRR